MCGNTAPTGTMITKPKSKLILRVLPQETTTSSVVEAGIPAAIAAVSPTVRTTPSSLLLPTSVSVWWKNKPLPFSQEGRWGTFFALNLKLTIRLRHGSYQNVDCFIGDEQVSEYRFRKALESFVLPSLTSEEKQHIEAEQQRLDAVLREVKIKASRRKSRSQEVNIRQLSFNFAI